MVNVWLDENSTAYFADKMKHREKPQLKFYEETNDQCGWIEF